MKKLLLIPSIFEANAIFKHFGYSAKLGKLVNISENFSVLVSGIGCEASKQRVENAVKNIRPSTIILMGYCGACSDEFNNGDFLYETNNQHLENLLSPLNIKTARIACVDKTADEHVKINLQKQGYDAVEMECKYFQPIAQNIDADFLHLRCVSDAKKSPIPADLLDCTMDRTTGNVVPTKMLSPAKLLRNPSILLKLIKFGIEIAPTQKLYAKKSVEIVKLLSK